MSAYQNIHLNIGSKVIGDGKPCFFIAEIGSNHNQDLNLARKIIDAAAEAGADAVKFQTFRAADHYSRHAPGFNYLDNANTYDLIKSLELNRSWHGDLKRHAENQGVAFFSSPCDLDAVRDLAKLGIPAYKVASFDLPDDILIAEIAKTGKPVILSTGMATWEEIHWAIDACRQQMNNQIILLQCTSLYPAPARLSNLMAMNAMRKKFGALVGYSDHTMGDHVSLAAVSMGACIVEKHFTIDRRLPGPDHAFAMEQEEMAAMIRKAREIEAALGEGAKDGPRQEEHEMAEKGRRSLHARAPIAAGQAITAAMLVVKRPGLGISPLLKRKLIGQIAKQNIEADQWITWDMF